MSDRRAAPVPIHEVLPAVLQALRERDSVVVHAPTGAGKTTALPPALLEEGYRRILILEPRRIAARSAARYVSAQRGGKLGAEVGYHVRFDRRASERTRLLYLTDGMALRRVQHDPFIEDVDVVIFDEFHERSLAADLTLAMVRRVQQELRPELKIVVMSATLDATRVAGWLDDAPVVRSQGRSYPVDVQWLPRPDDRPIAAQAGAAVRRAMQRADGDVLVFLPGVAEIHRTAGYLTDLPVDVLPLYGRLPPREQDRALRRGPRRRVVLATNVAETSLTLDGIEVVVDTGWARVLRHAPSTGLDRLVLEPISQASAEQRAGRAGRQAPGICLRCWTQASHSRRPQHDTPQLHRTDLCGPLLQLRAWGEPEPATFPWYEQPDPTSMAAADSTLHRLGLLDDSGLTDRGRQAAQLPLHPRLAVLLAHAARSGLAHRGAGLAAVLSDRDPFDRRGGPTATCDSDLLDRLYALQGGDPRLRPGSQQTWRRVRDQLMGLTAQHGIAPADADGALRQAVLAGWPDRVARRRQPESSRARMVGGRGVRLADESGVREAEFFVCTNVDDGATGTRSEALVRMATAVDRAWLPTKDRVQVTFNEELRRVTARKQSIYGDLVLRSSTASVPNDEHTLSCLVASCEGRLELALPLKDPAVSSLRARIDGLHRWMPELGFPKPDEHWLTALLPTLCRDKRAWDQLTASATCQAMSTQLDHRQRAALAEHAPVTLRVPSGSEIRLTYELDRPPVLAVRIQEMFGLARTPRVAAGRVPVLLHLLAPNRRPAQITDDLQSFWANTWDEVRKDLRRRYPKHAWPDDPANAKAERRTRRRRR